MDIEGKSAIVTGAASGIGRATAWHLAQHGATDLRLVDIDPAGLAETARLLASFPARTSQHQLDLADRDATAAWFHRHAAVDILHNNAGVVAT
jgi:3-oxoacyl-[acyl-carrier protein] reductase